MQTYTHLSKALCICRWLKNVSNVCPGVCSPAVMGGESERVGGKENEPVAQTPPTLEIYNTVSRLKSAFF